MRPLHKQIYKELNLFLKKYTKQKTYLQLFNHCSRSTFWTPSNFLPSSLLFSCSFKKKKTRWEVFTFVLSGLWWNQTRKTNGLAGCRTESRQRGYSGIFPTCKIMQKVNTQAEGYKNTKAEHGRHLRHVLSQGPPPQTLLLCDWTYHSHVGFLLDHRRVNHGLTSMTSIVHCVRGCRLGWTV